MKDILLKLTLTLGICVLLFASIAIGPEVMAETEINVHHKESIDYKVRQWILDEEQGYIYALAIMEQKHRLLFIRLSDLQVEKEIELDGRAGDMVLQQNRLYVKDSYFIHIINVSTQSTVKKLDFRPLPDNFAIDGDKLFYTENWASSEAQPAGWKLYEYHLLKDTVKELPFGSDFNDIFTEPELAVDLNNHVLYIAESKGTAQIKSISTDDYTRIDKFEKNEIDNNYNKILFVENEVFYAGRRIGTNLENIYNNYYDQNIRYIKDRYVFTNQAIFDRETAEKIITLPVRPGIEYWGPFLVDSSGYIYVITSEVGEFEFKKLTLENEPERNDSEHIDKHDNAMFLDIQKHWAKGDVELLAQANLVKGISDSMFAPAQDITRAQYVTLLSRGLKLSPATIESTFKDVNKSAWYASPIQAAVDAGIAKGYDDGTFKPHQNITREELVVMTARALEYVNGGQEADMLVVESFLDHSKIASWAKSATAIAISNGLIQGYSEGQFAPKELANRAQSAVILKRLLLNSKKKDDLIHSVKGYQMGKYAQLAFPTKSDLMVTLSESSKSIGISIVSVSNDVTGEKHEILSHSYRPFGWDGKTYEFDVYQDLVPGTTYVVTYKVSFPYGNQSFEKKITVPADHLTVQSVTALNASQLQVKFNGDIDVISSVNIENYQIIGTDGIVPLKNAVINDPNFANNVILNLDKPIKDQSVLQVSVYGIKSTGGDRVFPPYEQKILVMRDETNPVIDFPPGHYGKNYIIEHDGESYKSMVLYFSEPISSGTIKIDGVPVGEVSGEMLELSGLNLDGKEWHTVWVENLSDTAGNVNQFGFSIKPIDYNPSFDTELE